MVHHLWRTSATKFVALNFLPVLSVTGCPSGCGKALTAKRKNLPWRTYVRCIERRRIGRRLELGGHSLFAPQHRLDNLTVIIDYNKIQSLGSVEEVLELAPLADKFRAFRWAVREIDAP